MFRSLYALLRRRTNAATPPANVKRKPARRWQPSFEVLEDRTVPSTYSIASSFTASAVAPGGTLWFSSVAGSVTGFGSNPATIHVTNQTITFADTLNGVTTSYNLTLPDADLTLTPGATSATTTFNSTQNKWFTNVPTGLAGNVFLSGFALPLPNGLHGSDNPVTWTAQFTTDTSGVNFNWSWAAAAYTSFNTGYGALGIKPCDSSTASSFSNMDKAGTPENYKTNVTGGAKGNGGTNYTGLYTSVTSVAPTYVPIYVTISGVIYYDANSNGVLDNYESGIPGVALTLTGTNILGQSITATTTTGPTGTYSFSTDSKGNSLWPGTYQLAEAQPNGYVQGGNAVGTVIGTPGLSSVNWDLGYQTVLNNTDTSGAGTTPGFAHDIVNSQTDDIFTGGQSKDINDVSQWQWTQQKPQNKDDVCDAFTASFPDATTGHKIVMMGMDRYSNNGDTTAGFWCFQNPVSLNADGTFSGVHSNGDLLIVVDFAGSGSSAVQVYRWTGNNTTGSLQAYSPPSGSTYFFVNSGPYSVPWSYVDASGFTSPQAGEYLKVGLDFTAIFGPNLPRFSTFLAETRSSNSPTSTLSDFVLGTFNTIETVIGTPSGTLVPTDKIGSIQLGSNQSAINFNFGESKPVTISGTVYYDANADGVLNTGEPGIAGATVTLTGTNIAGQSITATTTTGANGTYSFATDSSGNLLAPGTYQLAETPPSGYIPAINSVGTVNGSTDGTLLPGNKIGSIVLLSTQSGINYNFGNLRPVTISGLVYNDTNGNGALNSGEPGIAGVTLTLSGTNYLGQSVTGTTTTAANGTFSLTTDSTGSLLAPGTYQVVESHPAGYLPGSTSVGTVSGTTDGVVVSLGTIGSIVVTTGQNGINYDFGEVRPVTLSGTVYHDANANGRLDSGEAGIAGVTLTLSGTNNLGQSISATTTTASNGTYSFATDSDGNSLRPGTYQIAETQPTGYLQGLNTVGTVNGTTDGTLVPVDKIGSIAMTSGQSGINYNFGEVKPVTLSGTVYQDTNGNGSFDAGEPGIAGVTLTLTGTNILGQSVSATTTTAADGTYSFTIDSNGNLLEPGTYQVAETQPSGFLQGTNAVGTVNGTVDGTLIPVDKIGSIILASNQSGINYNFGEVNGVVISGLVYQDSNLNGVPDSNEPGIASVTLTLTGTNNLGQSITATTTTASNGTFSFATDNNGNSLRPGTYQVAETQPTGYLQGTNTVGTVNGTVDGTLIPVDKIGSIVLTSGQLGINYDFGEIKPVSISGNVYQDSNRNGVLDSGEPGIAGVTLTLSGTNGLGQSITATTTTATNGTYSFTTDSNGNALLPGTYQVAETQPAGYFQGTNTVGTVDGTPDGTLIPVDIIGSIVMASGQSGINYNFGEIKPVTISGTVYLDANANGILDAGDTGIAGVTITLTGTTTGGQSVSVTTTTAADGTYSFITDSDGVPLWGGTYQLAETQPSGYLQGVNTVGTVNGTTDGTLVPVDKIGSIVTTAGQNGINYNFGEVLPVTITGGTVYLDTNTNGALDAGESGVQNVTLTLTGTNNLGQAVTVTTTTDAQGAYSFTVDSNGNSLAPGTYQITETTPAGYVQVAANVGTVNGTVNGTQASSGEISTITLNSGQNGINDNFGLSIPVAVTGYVYLDFNRNGVRDSGDGAFANQTLNLVGTDALGRSVSLTAKTDVNGYYIFSNLLAGTYEVDLVPTIYASDAANVGTVNGVTVGEANTDTFQALSQILLNPGDTGLDYDFGVIRPHA
jgi:hypothetical protein